ncbi:MAG: hypothetical protein HY069_03055 [Chlamydiia bacterium]|nr:hypothetical protein [Chlamydiia bacterium]
MMRIVLRNKRFYTNSDDSVNHTTTRGGQPETVCVEQWRCRFLSDSGNGVSQHDVIQVLHAFDHVQMDVFKSEFLYLMDGKPWYSSAEG